MNVKEIMNENLTKELERSEARTGYYKPAPFSIDAARSRQSFLLESIRMLDATMQHNSDCSTFTRNSYCDLRGMMLNLIEHEQDNIKAGLMI